MEEKKALIYPRVKARVFLPQGEVKTFIGEYKGEERAGYYCLKLGDGAQVYLPVACTIMELRGVN